MTSDSFILECIKGVHIQFDSNVAQNIVVPPIKCSNVIRDKINCLIIKFISTGIIEEVTHCDGEVISHIFPVPKKNGDIRLILNLKPLNVHLSYEHFKMEHLHCALGLMEENCYMASIDLTDAYYSVNIHEGFRKYLRFLWNDKLYQFTCMAQGLSCAPRIFTKIMKPLFAKLRSEGFLSVFYLDDSLLIGKDFCDCSVNVSKTSKLLTEAGFIINCEKSQFLPVTEIKFLGFILNSNDMTVTLPIDKKQKIVDLCNKYLLDSSSKIRDIASLIGLLISSLPGVQYGALFCRYLELCKISALKHSRGNFDKNMTLDDNAKLELKWWIANVMSSYKTIRVPPHSHCITTDASLSGWGCVYMNETTGGRWSKDESDIHINVLELKAVLLSLQTFLSHVTSSHIKIKSDNSTAVSYINNLGGVKSITCHKIAREIWIWAISRNNHISAEHLPGVENVVADKASRVFDENTEWQLVPTIFNYISDRLGPFDIDLFASRLNFQCSDYCSWKPDPTAKFIDAFSISWAQFTNSYLFPPFSVILKCLQKICQDQTRVVMIVPLWTTQPWFPKLVRMFIDAPIILPLGILRLPFKEQATHKLHKNLRLIVCRLSGITSETNNFLLKQSPSSSLPGENPPCFNIQYILKNGYISVLNGRLIPCSIMK